MKITKNKETKANTKEDKDKAKLLKITSTIRVSQRLNKKNKKERRSKLNAILNFKNEKKDKVLAKKNKKNKILSKESPIKVTPSKTIKVRKPSPKVTSPSNHVPTSSIKNHSSPPIKVKTSRTSSSKITPSLKVPLPIPIKTRNSSSKITSSISTKVASSTTDIKVRASERNIKKKLSTELDSQERLLRKRKPSKPEILNSSLTKRKKISPPIKSKQKATKNIKKTLKKKINKASNLKNKIVYKKIQISEKIKKKLIKKAKPPLNKKRNLSKIKKKSNLSNIKKKLNLSNIKKKTNLSKIKKVKKQTNLTKNKKLTKSSIKRAIAYNCSICKKKFKNSLLGLKHQLTHNKKNISIILTKCDSHPLLNILSNDEILENKDQPVENEISYSNNIIEEETAKLEIVSEEISTLNETKINESSELVINKPTTVEEPKCNKEEEKNNEMVLNENTNQEELECNEDEEETVKNIQNFIKSSFSENKNEENDTNLEEKQNEYKIVIFNEDCRPENEKNGELSTNTQNPSENLCEEGNSDEGIANNEEIDKNKSEENEEIREDISKPIDNIELHEESCINGEEENLIKEQIENMEMEEISEENDTSAPINIIQMNDENIAEKENPNKEEIFTNGIETTSEEINMESVEINENENVSLPDNTNKLPEQSEKNQIEQENSNKEEKEREIANEENQASEENLNIPNDKLLDNKPNDKSEEYAENISNHNEIVNNKITENHSTNQTLPNNTDNTVNIKSSLIKESLNHQPINNINDTDSTITIHKNCNIEPVTSVKKNEGVLCKDNSPPMIKIFYPPNSEESSV